jgi:hypothetical protein
VWRAEKRALSGQSSLFSILLVLISMAGASKPATSAISRTVTPAWIKMPMASLNKLTVCSLLNIDASWLLVRN